MPRTRQFGDCWLGRRLFLELQLAQFFSAHLGEDWAKVVELLTAEMRTELVVGLTPDGATGGGALHGGIPALLPMGICETEAVGGVQSLIPAMVLAGH